MSDNDNSETKGTHLLPAKDFVKVVDAEGNELPPVPKHWGTDQLPAGATKKGRSSSSSSGSSDSGTSSQAAAKPDGEPAGNASTEDWAAYARTVKGAADADLLDADGKPLGQQALRAKYGTPAS